jgi:hypothetical protein
MKKIIASAVGLMLVGGVAATTASAVESQFGGYWRTRAFFEDNFTQPDSDFNTVDTRTRLYYTAKFNDNFKFVNKFEFNNTWGDSVGGDIGADGTSIFRIKNSYADFTLGKVNTKVGIQGATISRGFIFSDDFSGVVVTADLGMVKIPVLYGAVSTEDAGAKADSVTFFSPNNPSLTLGGGNGDIHLLSVMPNIKVNDMVSITPHATWITVTHQDTDVYYLGADVDLKFDPVKVGLTGIYNGGSVDKVNTGAADDSDISAWLLAASADANLGMVGVHGQAFYASGDDGKDIDVDGFVTIGSGYGTSYYWSEIMGYGTFDHSASNNSPADNITNIWALNAGVDVKPMDKLSFTFDVWYAQLDEEVLSPFTGQLEDSLGLELDSKLSYAIMDNLKADLIFAYLFAGDATGPEDVMEGGLQLSLSF